MARNNVEIDVYKKATSAAITAAEALAVEKYEDVMDAADFLYKVKGIGEQITEKKETITKPANETLKAARTMFKPLEDMYAKAEAIAKAKVMEWHRKNWEEDKQTDNTISGTQGKVTVVEQMKVTIIDEALIPREFLVPDVKRIEHALKAGLKVEGAELIQDYYITAAKL